MPCDLRSFLRDAEEAGMLYRVNREVDPHKNLAALADESDRAVQFTSVAGYDGWQVVANLGNDRAMEAVTFKSAQKDVVQTFSEALDRGHGSHTVVDDGPVKEVIWRGEDADVRRLPVAVNSELDGGAYVSGGIGVVVDPETGLHNTTFPRFQVADGRRCRLYIYSPHVSQIMGKYAAQKRSTPMAIVIGHHPMWEIAAASSTHHPQWGELDYVGAWLGEPTEFVRCETIDVDVPAHAEIVIEGNIVFGEVEDEGPFGNYLGTYSSGPMAKAGIQKAPVFEVSCITMRHDAIYRHLQATVWTDHQRLCMLPVEATVFTALREMMVNVHDVYMPPWGGCGLTLIQMSPGQPGEAQDALLKAALWENTTISFMSQVAVAVNRDVNIYDARDVMWAMATRADWRDRTTIIPGTRSSPLHPIAKRVPGARFRVGSKALIDATHLPPKDESEWWDFTRVWPQGKGTVSLADFVDDYRPAPTIHERLVPPEDPAKLFGRN